MKILHVMSEFPYPPDNGVRADIWGRLQTMSHLGHTIDALVMNTKRVPTSGDTAEMRRFVNDLKFIDRTPLRPLLAINRSRGCTYTSNMTLQLPRETASMQFSRTQDCGPQYARCAYTMTRVVGCWQARRPKKLS